MSSISSSIGLISGIDTGSLVNQLMALEAQSKYPIQQRIVGLQAAQAAMLDINSSLLALKNIASSFRNENVFGAANANSSNQDVMQAFASSGVVPGTYSFYVKQLMSTSQKLSMGFATSDSTPMGLDSVTFEFGQGRLGTDKNLSELNGDDGVRRGRISITDSLGNNAIVDLSMATTINEVIQRINQAAGLSITAEATGDGLTITDQSGGAGALTVANHGGSFTATDLGIEGTSAEGRIDGASIMSIGAQTALSTLNDGNGVFIRDNAVDFRLQLNNVNVFDIDLGRIDAPIEAGTLLSDLNNGDGIAINSTNDPDLLIRTSDGTNIEIDLGRILDTDGTVLEEAVTTVGQLLDRVNQSLELELGEGEVVMSLNETSDGFLLQDNLGGADPIEVLGAGVNGSQTAEDLGIYTGSGGGSGDLIVGSTIPNNVQMDRVSTIQELMDRVSQQTLGRARITISDDGHRLEFFSEFGNISFLPGDGDGSSQSEQITNQTRSDLGLMSAESNSNITGTRIISGLDSTLVKNLNGGNGLMGGSTLDINDRTGVSTVITDLDQAETIDELLDTINQQLQAGGVGVTARLNDEGIGLLLVDSTGGDFPLNVTGDARDALGLNISEFSDRMIGSNLEHRYLDFGTKLDTLNYGRGIGLGTFRITDSSGQSAVVDIAADSSTLHDVMREINSRGLAVEAQINANGDGLVLIDTNTDTPITALTVETVTGSTAADLNLVGSADAPGGNLDASYARMVDLDASDTIEQVIEKINQANIPVDASFMNTGQGSNSFRLSLASKISGYDGELVIDTHGVDIGLSVLSSGRDAKIFIGNDDPSQSIVISSSSNTFDSVIPGLELQAVSASDELVTINVDKDESQAIGRIQEFVEAFNAIIEKINSYDSYDAESQARGPLLGDSTVSMIKNMLHSTVQGSSMGTETGFQYLYEVGISIGADGLLELDQERLDAAMQSDPSAVEALFAAFEQETITEEELLPGVTIPADGVQTTRLGFGDLFDQLLEGMTDSTNGTISIADDRFQTLIDAANRRIEAIDERLEAKRLRLEREFAAMETALAKLQGQQSALASLASSAAFASFGGLAQ